jgi:hypothetical protein
MLPPVLEVSPQYICGHIQINADFSGFGKPMRISERLKAEEMRSSENVI